MTDRFTVRAVVLGVIAFGMVGLIGALVLTAIGRPVPDPMWGFIGGALGALGALLARTGSDGGGQAMPVTVVNQPHEAVPVEAGDDLAPIP